MSILQSRPLSSLVPVTVVTTVCLIALTLTDTVRGDTVGLTTIPTVDVTSSGKATANPDVAHISFSINTRQDSVEQGRQRVSAHTHKARDIMLRAGIEEKHINTNNFNVQPAYEWQDPGFSRRKSSRITVGYDVSTTLNVKIVDLSSVSKVLDDVVKAVGDDISVHSVHFKVENTDAVEDQARVQAAKRARRQAEILVQEAGGPGAKVGRLLRITNSDNAGYQYGHNNFRQFYKAAPMMAEAAMSISDDGGMNVGASPPSGIPLSAGEYKVEMTTSASFEIIYDSSSS